MVRSKVKCLRQLGAWAIAVGLWQIAAALVDNPLLLATPAQVAAKLVTLVGEGRFWATIGFSLSRISLGFLLAFGLALGLAALAARFPVAEELIAPYITVVKTVPVVSFIVMALLWLSGGKLSIFISFLMVLPVLYSNFLEGFRASDHQLEEMAQIFPVSRWNRLRYIYLPALDPYCLSACRSALGLCWKAGIAAEVMAVCSGSMGAMLYEAKIYLEMDGLLAWTVAIVAVSAGFSKGFLWGLGWLLRRIEG